MAAFVPFMPAVQSATTGKTVSVTVSTTVSTFLTQVISSNSENPSLLVTAVNPNGVPMTAYLRMSIEASTVIAPTNSDTPISIPANNATVRLFANPAPIGTANIAVFITVASSTSGGVFYFTPGQGGSL